MITHKYRGSTAVPFDMKRLLNPGGAEGIVHKFGKITIKGAKCFWCVRV
jgi:hypothetical protein